VPGRVVVNKSMWTFIKSSFEALLSYSPMALIIGMVIIVLSVVDAFLSKKTGKERATSVTVAILSVLLLFVQAKTGELSEAKSQTKLQAALQRQREDLTKAFSTGTDQVIKATSKSAKQTQENARQQSDAIRQQADEQFARNQQIMLGSPLCPIVQGGILDGSKTGQISVSNNDPQLNMYDISVVFTEFGPDQTSGHDEKWNKVLQVQPVNFPALPRRRATYAPVTFLSKMTDIHVEYFVTSRTAICYGSFNLFDTEKNGWVLDLVEESNGERNLSYAERHLSPRLSQSKPDPNQ
jgi:hypothetical protein